MAERYCSANFKSGEDLDRALIAAMNAESNAERAEAAMNAAETAANDAAAKIENDLIGLVGEAEKAETGAKAAQVGAETAESAAENAKNAAEQAKTDAQVAQAAAEKARDEAKSATDFASTDYVDEKAETAENNAKSYTDEKFSDIPTPDVSGQIDTHNTDTSAHADIRQTIDDLTAADVGAVSKSGDTMSGNLFIQKTLPRVRLKCTGYYTETALESGGNSARLYSYNSSSSVLNGRYLEVCNSGAKSNMADALRFVNLSGGATTANYAVYHTGNKPTAADVGAPTVEEMNAAISAAIGAALEASY